MTTERGNVSVLMLAVVVLTGICCVAVARVGGAAARKARADTAADAAALAAADALALGRSPGAARAAAETVAVANGAVLKTCVCEGAAAEVTVTFADAHGRARAEVGPPTGSSRAYPDR